MKDFHRDVVNVRLGLKTKEDALEELRRGLVNSMRLGANFVINLDKIHDIDFETEWTQDGVFPIKVFNYDEWRESENFLTVVREEENKGFEGDDKFDMQEKFNMVLLCAYDTDEQLYKVTKSIPNWDDYSMFIVKEMTKEEL